MSRRAILFTVLGIVLLLATIHFTVNGLPSLSSLNPHAR